MKRPNAFILLGGFTSGKYPEFVRYLKQRGLSILVIDEKNERTTSQEGQKKINHDHFLNQIDHYTFFEGDDWAGIFRQATIWEKSFTIVGVYTIRESFVTTLGLLGDYFHLPHPGLRATRVCRNKYLQRLYLKKWSPTFQILERRKDEIFSVSFPAVLKPTGRQASSGVILVKNSSELKKELGYYGADETLLLEEYIVGEEFSVESLVQKRNIIFQNITQKRTNHTTSRFFVETGHTIPAQNLNQSQKNIIYQINEDILKRLDFQDGIAHAEFKISQNGRIYLMEVAARNPGDGILPLYYLATGMFMERELIKIALGEKADYPQPKRIARQVYMEHTAGKFIDVQLSLFPIAPHFYCTTGMRPPLPTVSSLDGAVLREILIEKEKGSMLGPVRQSSDRCGAFLMDAQDIFSLNTLEKQVKENLKIITEE